MSRKVLIGFACCGLWCISLSCAKEEIKIGGGSSSISGTTTGGSAGGRECGTIAEGYGINIFKACLPSTTAITMNGTGNDVFVVAEDVVLDKAIIRGGETPWANFFADAGLAAMRYHLVKNPDIVNPIVSKIDLFMIEAGGFRIKQPVGGDWTNTESADVGIIPSGTTVTEGDIDNIFFPFGNTLQVMKFTLEELVKWFEIGGQTIPNSNCTASGNGYLTIPSGNVKLVYDSNGSNTTFDNADPPNFTPLGDKLKEMWIDDQKVYDKTVGSYFDDHFLINKSTEYYVASDNFFLGVGGTDGKRGIILTGKSSDYDSPNTDYSIDLAIGARIVAEGGVFTNTCEGRIIIQ